MNDARLPLSCGCFLSPVQITDQAALVAHLQEPQIHRQTLRLPFPYTEQDAERWLKFMISQTDKPAITVMAIRNHDAQLIGVIGVERGTGAALCTGEIGYWLAKPFWNQGISTRALGSFVQFAFERLGYLRLEATVFPGNEASFRVLEKTGFQREGFLRARYFRRDEVIDCFMYSRVDVTAWRTFLAASKVKNDRPAQ